MNVRSIVSIANILVILFATACKKENGGGTRLSELVFNDTYDSTGSVLFDYDGNGRISGITNTFKSSPRYKTSFTYDASGRLQSTQQITFNFSSYIATQSYQYSGDNLVKKIYDNPQPSGHYYFNYSYNPQGKLIADTLYGFSVSIASYNSFVYTNDNLTEWETFFGSHTAGWQSAGKTKVVYNNASNPFYENGLLSFITMGDFTKGIITLSKSLVSSIEYPNGEVIEYQYDYYDNGLVKKANIKSKKSGYRQTIEFYYE